MIFYGTLNYHRKPYISCRVSIALFVIAFLMIIGISSAYFYLNWFLRKDITRVKFNTNTQTIIY